MKNDDAYRILLSAGVEAEEAVHEDLDSPMLSPSFEIVYINGEGYHLYNAYYHTLDGDDGQKQVCVVTDDGRGSYRIHLEDGTDLSKSRSDEISFDDDSRKVLLLGDIDLDYVVSTSYPDYGTPIEFYSIRTLVKAGSSAQNVVTYDHPFDFYNGVWNRSTTGSSGGFVSSFEFQFSKPCLTGKYYACGSSGGNGGSGGANAPEFTIDDCVVGYSGMGKGRYYTFNRYKKSKSYGSEGESIPYYRHTYRYMTYADDVYSNPQEVSKQQIGTIDISSNTYISAVKKSAAKMIVQKTVNEEEETVWLPFYSGSTIDRYALAIARDCGYGRTNMYGTCIGPGHDPYWECYNAKESDSVTQYSWALFKRVCEGTFKNVGVTVQTKYGIITRDYPNGSWKLGGCGYESWQYGECLNVQSFIVRNDNWERDEEGNGCAVSLVGTPWICSEAPSAPGSTTWSPVCPEQSDECKKYFIIVKKEEYGSTSNCNSPVLAKLHWHEAPIDITEEYMSGRYKKSNYEYSKIPYVIGTARANCVDCQGNPKKSDIMYTVNGNGPYRSQVVVFREYDSVDGNGVTAEEKISDVYDSISTGDVRTITVTQTGCACMKYVRAMGAEPVYISLGNVCLGGFTDGNGNLVRADTFTPGVEQVDGLYNGWTWDVVAVNSENGYTSILPVPLVNLSVIGNGTLYGEFVDPEFIDENGTHVVTGIPVPYYGGNLRDDPHYADAFLKLTPPC